MLKLKKVRRFYGGNNGRAALYFLQRSGSTQPTNKHGGRHGIVLPQFATLNKPRTFRMSAPVQIILDIGGEFLKTPKSRNAGRHSLARSLLYFPWRVNHIHARRLQTRISNCDGFLFWPWRDTPRPCAGKNPRRACQSPGPYLHSRGRIPPGAIV
jgi:hypothetical protein